MKRFVATNPKLLKAGKFLLLSFCTAALLFSYRSNPDEGTPPDANRFTKVGLTDAGKLDEPMEMTFLPDGRVLIVERKGGLKAVDPKTGAVKLITTVPVNTKYKNKKGQVREAGTHQELLNLHGLYWRLYQLQYVEEKIHSSAPPASNPNLSLETGI